jgi:hypothetical protein
VGGQDDNPIAARIDRLQDQWTLFVRDADARMLRWVLDEDELPLVEGFFIRESHPDASKTPDLFWTSGAPFRDASRHGAALRQELCATYESARAALAEAGVQAMWAPAPVRSEASDIDVWLEALSSFRGAHPGVEVLAVCLRPTESASASAYVSWLGGLARAAPPELRFVLLERSSDVEARVFEPLAAAEPKRVRTQRARLDVPGALEEVSAAAGNLDEPGGQFRHLYVQMSAAAKGGDLGTAEALGARALAISEAEQWFSLSCAVHFLQGSFFLRAGRHADAVRRFVLADAAGARADERGDAQGKRLRVQARLSAGSALLAAEDFPGSARVFTEAAPFAVAAQDPRAELDCWRLASYAHARVGDADKTWKAGRAALGVGRAMDDETRKTSTLKNLGQSLVFWAKEQGLPEVESTVQRELDAMLGRGWAS